MQPSKTTLARLLAVVLLLVPLVALLPNAEAATTRVLAITTSSAQPIVPFAGFDGNPPKVYDINGDGQLEIIAQNDNQWFYVFDSKTGSILFQAKTTFPPSWGARSFNGPEVSIMSAGGRVHLIVANSAATITDYSFDQAGSTSARFVFHKDWERRLTDCHADPGMDSKPVLHDLDKDGRLEILAQTEELGVYALRNDGTLFWKNCIGGGNGEPSVADLNMDTWPDAVFASDAGVVSALNGRTGAFLWSYDILKSFNLGSASIPVGAGIGQLDGVGPPEIVVGARDSHNPDNWPENHALLLALKGTGQLLWARQDPGGNPLTYTHPVVVDADQDGKNEVYWGDWNTIGHKPPFNEADAWKPTGPAHFYRYDHAGNLVWRQSLDTWWSNKDVPIADVDGDGVQEMLANGPNGASDGIWYLDTRTGAKEEFVSTAPWSVARAPVVANLWGTGTMQWVVEVGGSASAGGPGILVYDTHVPYSAAWPHLPYPETPNANPPPPPGGPFAATFTIKSPNEWWQEVYVQPEVPRDVTRVDVRVNGGAWKPLTLRSWGAWAGSYQAPAGSRVEFLATAVGGGTSQSEAFTWMDGTLTKPSVDPGTTTTTQPPPTTTTSAPPPTTSPSTSAPPPTTTSPSPTTSSPPPTDFTATFTVPSGVNAWWVEVKVTANKQLAGVDVRINNGAWTPLSATSWGTWAKSLNAPAGSMVQFRATSNAGDQVLSSTYRWLDDGSGVFTATFQPQAVGNDWWVEVKVSSTHPITKVEASLNGGAWQALNPTNWGTWAKSINAPNGTSVRFRATNDAGATVVSDPVVWS